MNRGEKFHLLCVGGREEKYGEIDPIINFQWEEVEFWGCCVISNGLIHLEIG